MAKLKQILYQWRRWSIVRAEKLRGLYHAKTWSGAVLFVLIGVVLALVIQQVLLMGLKHSGEGNIGIMNRVMRGQIDADILISGSSRSMYHFDPRIIEAETKLKAYNIGRDGTKLHEQLELLQLYLLRNKSPAFLIQSLDIWSLQKNDDITDPKQYISWLNYDEVYNPLFQRKRYYFFYRWCPLLSMVRTGGTLAALRGLFNPLISKTDELRGYSPQDLTWNKDFERFKAQNPLGIKLTPDPQKIQSLVDILEICKKRGIRVILVFPPEYLETQGFFLNRKDTFKIFKDLADRFQVPFWDYSENPMCSKKAYFYNSQHLNQVGATVFSKSIAQRLKMEIPTMMGSILK